MKQAAISLTLASVLLSAVPSSASDGVSEDLTIGNTWTSESHHFGDTGLFNIMPPSIAAYNGQSHRLRSIGDGMWLQFASGGWDWARNQPAAFARYMVEVDRFDIDDSTYFVRLRDAAWPWLEYDLYVMTSRSSNSVTTLFQLYLYGGNEYLGAITGNNVQYIIR